tara:strand:- start:6 stop:386 length:381 start_codon:yes stop_codon:yes gene_type:complete
MRTKWSRSWNRSIQPRKQRKFIFNAPTHIRRKLFGAPLSKELRKQHKKRTLTLRKGDTVKILRGQFKGTMAKVESINTKKLRIYVKGVEQTKATGQMAPYPIHPSNVMIITPDLSDKKRKEALARK